MTYSCSPEQPRLTGPENMATERTLSTFSALGAVNSPTRITLENNAKIRPQPDRENAFARASGGGNGTAVQPSLGRKLLKLMNRQPFGNPFGANATGIQLVRFGPPTRRQSVKHSGARRLTSQKLRQGARASCSTGLSKPAVSGFP